MNDQLLQSPWQKAKHIKPRLSSELRVFKRSFRGENWYVLQRSGSERLFRVNPEAWRIIGLCNGERTLETIFATVKSSDPELNETDLLTVVYQFFHEGLIQLDDQVHMPKNADRHIGGVWLKKLKNPLAIRFPLWNPDRFLQQHQSKVAFLFSYRMLMLWAAVVLTGLLTAAMNWSAITHDVVDKVFSPGNLLLLWLIYPATKLIHELGHAFAIKVHGGQVNEIGVTLMFGTFLPYVDATAALTFAHKRQRLLVDAIGIVVELFIATLALFVWLNVSSGLISQLAYNTMIICSVSTLFFNGNPLMRFDGYYLLEDALEIPNLGARSSRYWRHLFSRHLLRDNKDFVADNREKWWLTGYAPLALIYRMTMLFAIIMVGAELYLPLGIALGVWLITTNVVNPLVRTFQYLLRGEASNAQRLRRRKVAITLPAVALLVLVAIPFPVERTLPAVVWMPEHSELRAGADGLITELLAGQGDKVKAGQRLMQLSDPYLTTRKDIAQARYEEVSSRLRAAMAADLVEAQQLQEELASSKAELDTLQRELGQLDITSAAAGRFYLPPNRDGLGLFAHKGDVLAYVLDRDHVMLRVMAGQNEIGLLQQRSKSLKVKLANWPAETYQGHLVRVLPAGSKALPSAVLGTQYGGDIGVDPADKRGVTALEQWFQLEVEVEAGARDVSTDPLWVGSRAWVRFDLGYAPLVTQIYWSARQLFMKKLLL